MADYIATARTNYFRVKNLAAFRENAPADLDIVPEHGEIQDADSTSMIALFSGSDHGTWPSTTTIEVQLDPETDEPVGLDEDVEVLDVYTEVRDGQSVDVATVSFDTAEYVREHLAAGEIAYGLETGAEKQRFLGGYGWSTNGEQVIYLDLEDELLRRVQETFGATPATRAHH